MDVAELLIDLYGRVPEVVDGVLDGLSTEDLTAQPVKGCNTIGWLIWHVARVTDAQLSQLDGNAQLWDDQWAARFDTSPDPMNHGYGHTEEQMASIKPESPVALTEYLAAAFERANAYLATMTPEALDEVVDENFDPPVTRGVRLISIADDAIQHAGQAAYAKGELTR